LKKQVIAGIKGHLWPADVKGNILMLVLVDERRIFVNTDKYDSIEMSREWFELEADRVREESQGKANLQ
jgi:acyl carrier protein phosphodiesterase